MRDLKHCNNSIESLKNIQHIQHTTKSVLDDIYCTPLHGTDRFQALLFNLDRSEQLNSLNAVGCGVVLDFSRLYFYSYSTKWGYEWKAQLQVVRWAVLITIQNRWSFQQKQSSKLDVSFHIRENISWANKTFSQGLQLLAHRR